MSGLRYPKGARKPSALNAVNAVRSSASSSRPKRGAPDVLAPALFGGTQQAVEFQAVEVVEIDEEPTQVDLSFQSVDVDTSDSEDDDGYRFARVVAAVEEAAGEAAAGEEAAGEEAAVVPGNPVVDIVSPPPLSWEVIHIVWEDEEAHPDPIVEAVEALTVKRRGLTDPVLQKRLMDCLFTLSCGVVFDHTSTLGMRMNEQELNIYLTAQFQTHLTTFPAKAYARDELLRHLPPGTWEQHYPQHLSTMYNKPDHRDKTKELTEDEKKQRFGRLVRTTYRDAKKYIASNLAQYYIAVALLPSGKTREQLLRAIRRAMRPFECVSKAEDAKKAKVCRENAKAKKGLAPPPTDADAKKWYQHALDTAWQKIDPDWFPDCWLLFLMHSVPALDTDQHQVLPSFAGPKGLPATVNPLGPTQDAARMPPESPADAARTAGREARRAASAAAAGDGGIRAVGGARRAAPEDDDPAQAAKRQRAPLIHRIEHGNNRIDCQREVVALLVSAGASEDVVKTARAKLLDMLTAAVEAAV
jgi:hypothetical protein